MVRFSLTAALLLALLGAPPQASAQTLTFDFEENVFITPGAFTTSIFQTVGDFALVIDFGQPSAGFGDSTLLDFIINNPPGFVAPAELDPEGNDSVVNFVGTDPGPPPMNIFNVGFDLQNIVTGETLLEYTLDSITLGNIAELATVNIDFVFEAVNNVVPIDNTSPDEAGLVVATETADGVSFSELPAGFLQIQVVNDDTTADPEATSDFFTIDDIVLTLLVGPLEGDFNGDGVVDAADFTVWRDNLGAAEDGVLNGNGDGDGTVGIADYELWLASFGNVVGGEDPPAVSATPEPSALLLLLLGAPLAASRRVR